MTAHADLTLKTPRLAPPTPAPIVAPELPVARVTAVDHSATSSALSDAVLNTYKRAPGEFVRGEGVYLYDAEGKKYLDFVSGIAVNALGYGDPGLVAALHAAAADSRRAALSPRSRDRLRRRGLHAFADTHRRSSARPRCLTDGDRACASASRSRTRSGRFLCREHHGVRPG